MTLRDLVCIVADELLKSAGRRYPEPDQCFDRVSHEIRAASNATIPEIMRRTGLSPDSIIG